MNKEDIDLITEMAISKYGLQQIPSEWTQFLVFLLEKNVKNIIEIGRAKGGSTYCFANIADKVISVDMTPVLKEFVRKTRQMCSFYYFVKKSDKCYQLVSDCLAGERADLLFIDGDHSYMGVKKDFYRYIDLVSKHGIIALHDILDSPLHEKQGCFVHDFWKELKAAGYKYKEFVDGTEDWGGIGVIFK